MSCSHCDRVLVQVRKSGRPLQSCAHRLDTCCCGQLVEVLSAGNCELSCLLFDVILLNKVVGVNRMDRLASLLQSFDQKPGTVLKFSVSKSSAPEMKLKTKEISMREVKVVKIWAAQTASPAQLGSTINRYVAALPYVNCGSGFLKTQYSFSQPSSDLNKPSPTFEQTSGDSPLPNIGWQSLYQQSMLSEFPFYTVTFDLAASIVTKHPATPLPPIYSPNTPTHEAYGESAAVCMIGIV
jgi:hypothetical protein